MPASNQKLLLSLALLDEVGARYRIPTRALAGKVRNGTVEGDLWVSGRGDPTLTDRQRAYWGEIDAPTLAALARRVERAGITQITGRVMGATGYFRHDFDAPGWQSYVPRNYVQLASSLAINGNYKSRRGPERAAAKALARELERRGVDVAGRAGSSDPPSDLSRVAGVRSRPLADVVAFMNHTSNNFFAEMLGKLLGARVYGPPGTIAKGARAIDAWVEAAGGRARSYDSSGLSYQNRVSPAVIVKLLSGAESSQAGKALRNGLPSPGHGTLAYRLSGLDARAKTGSLFNGAVTLSGWVRSDKSDRWIAFSILGRNVPLRTIDRIVRVIARVRVQLPRPQRSHCPR